MTGPIYAERTRPTPSTPDDARPATEPATATAVQGGFPQVVPQTVIAQPGGQPASHRAASIAALRRTNGVAEAQEDDGEEAETTGLSIDGDEVSSADITRDSAYKKRLNSIISEEARSAGLAPVQVRNALVAMADDHQEVHAFDTAREAIQFAVATTIRRLVTRALADLTGDKLSKEVILARLTKEFHGTDQLHKATKVPDFADALLEAVRTKQSTTWVEATTIEEVEPASWTNDEMQHWNLRHYSSKFTAVLGRELAGGIFEIADVKPPPFKELLSTVTLATMTGSGPSTTVPKPGSTMMLTFTSGSATSGHTTAKDWQHIGNIGDTFYGLFYKDQPATGVTPNFIRDAVYYAVWPASEFGEGWASADWLGTAADSQKEGAKTPDDKARQGPMTDVIADIFPQATTRVLKDGKESVTDQATREAAFRKMDNFEVKQHGPRPVDTWNPVSSNVDKIKNWWVNASTGKIIKLPLLLPPEARAAL
ncbi:hypothetical protein [Nakamurella lactea]|uniref:hypothetical protein n=1 Tax=Nakamurella lactea TaxID=459515 RepID=UPI00041B5394|nr:hypothetical protein [Nakamurella lactea]